MINYKSFADVGLIPPVLVGSSGRQFYVDSATGSDQNPGTKEQPFDTLDYAVGKCTANNGDVIYVVEGHVETVIAAAGLDLDVAGITIVFLGQGNNRGYITFTTAVTADMDVDAADITLINPRFVAGIDALTGPIDVNAARFKMYNATWQDGTAINTTDCLVADANADDMLIDGFEFIDGNAAGTQKQSFIQIAGADRPILKNIKCTGDFGTGLIENGTAWVDAYLENIHIDNASASPTVAILLQATSSGEAHKVYCRVASGTTFVTANNDMQWFDCWGTGTDATRGIPIGTALATDLDTKNSSDLVIVQSDLKIVQSDLKIVQSDIKALHVEESDTKSDLVIVQSDLKIVQSDLKIVQSDLKGCNSDMKIAVSDLKIVQSDLKGCNSDMKILISDWLIFFAKYKSDNP